MEQSFKKKKWSNLYVKLTAKNPVLFLTLIVLCTFGVLWITMSTKVDVIHTYEAELEQDVVVVKNACIEDIDCIYVYENRNEAVYAVRLEDEMKDVSNNLLILPVDKLGFEPQSDYLKVDIPIRKISLFQRVFLQGGKNE